MSTFFSDIDWFLAYGNAEQSFFIRHSELYDAITLPGTVATFFRQGTGGFVLALNKPYIIDPRTSIFQSDFDRGRQGTRHIRLAQMHGPGPSAIMTTRALRPPDLQDNLLEEMARSVVDFQRTYAQTSSEKLEEYLELLGEEREEPSAPALILPPYFRFDSVHGPWHDASLSIATAAIRHRDSARICPVVCLSPRCLRAGQFDAIVQSYDLDAFDGYFLWVSQLNQYSSPPQDLRAFAELVRRFCATGRPVINLFGGYYSAMLTHLGLAGLSHGVGYGEARDAFYHRGGPPGERYYMPLLHRFYPRPDARVLLARLGPLATRCDCPACMEASQEGDAPEVQARLLDREGLLSHFVYTRRRELDHIRETPLDVLVSELRSTYDSIAEIHGPDVTVMGRIRHLSNWVEALP